MDFLWVASEQNTNMKYKGFVYNMIFLNISKSIRGNNFKIYQTVALDSLYISTRNDVIVYFRSVANRINVFIFGHDCSITVQSNSKRFTVLEKVGRFKGIFYCAVY